MPSTTQQHLIVRGGQANLHDFAESNSSNSNKRKKPHKLDHGSNMQPDLQDKSNNTNLQIHADDQLPPKRAPLAGHAGDHLEKEEEAAALLHHMQHAGAPHHHRAASADGMYNDNDNDDDNMGYDGARDQARRLIVDPGMLHEVAALHGAARENSGSSSNGSAAYFSGDSDLTAEPIMGQSCGTDDNEPDGAKSSNSGSNSTPVHKRKHPLTLRIDQTPPQTFKSERAGAGTLQAYSANLPIPNKKACNGNEDVDYASQMLTMTASTTSASRRCDNPETSIASPGRMHMPQQTSNCKRCNTSSPPESGDSGRNLTESWLELRLGFLPESKHRGLRMQAGKFYDGSRDEDNMIKWRESQHEDIVMEQERVTLQLLPEERPISLAETYSGASIKPSMAEHRNRPPITANFSSLYPPSIPPVYHPSTSTFLHNATPLEMSNLHRLSNGAIPPASGHPLLHNQSRDANAASTPYFDQFSLHINQSNSESYRLPATAGSYEQRANAYPHMQEGHGQRRWAASEALNSSISGQLPEVYRPTASLGWPPGGTTLLPGVDGRPWSASSIYNSIPQPQIQNNMSWQGLLRSMANEPLLHTHTLGDASVQRFNDHEAIMQTPGMRRRYMFPPACARPPPSHANTSSVCAIPQRLQLASSRHSSDLWFSLQEADPFNLNVKDQLSADHCMQKLYLRIRDGKMQISVVKSYLIKKLRSAGLQEYYHPDEVDITCRGQILSPSVTMQHVRDTIWFSKEDEGDQAIGFRLTSNQSKSSNPQIRVMDLCYQRHHTSNTLTLNLLKI